MNNYLYLEIVNFIEEKINNGLLEEGDKLPSERELAQQFKVSRNVVREGIKVLHEKGLVEVFPGRGAFVTKPDPLIITTTMERIIKNYETSIEDILEVREELEFIIINKAVKMATPRQIDKLYMLHNLMEKNKQDVNLFVKFDVQFHVTLAQSTQNQLFSILLNSFIEMTQHVLFSLTKLTPESIEQAQEQHFNIIEAIEQKDEVTARRVILEHMQMIREDIKLLRERKLL